MRVQNSLDYTRVYLQIVIISYRRRVCNVRHNDKKIGGVIARLNILNPTRLFLVLSRFRVTLWNTWSDDRFNVFKCIENK